MLLRSIHPCRERARPSSNKTQNVDYFVISTVALCVSALTFFSGFGLGTLLMPAFALFFPLPVAIAATAVVHLANNLFKLALVGRHAHLGVVFRFGLPALITAVAGASALVGISRLDTPVTIGALTVTPLKLAIGCLIVAFALLELTPKFSRWSLPLEYLPVGGVVSGFFGGLSGNQGAFRAAFLIKAGLTKTAFVATGVVCSVLVDTARIAIYGAAFFGAFISNTSDQLSGLVAVATISAFAGAIIGRRLLEKVTLRGVQLIVAAAMIGIGVAMILGLV
ncbi:MAG: sulfite exporter TauE/SafE family protein [Pseudomonadota bacterium]